MLTLFVACDLLFVSVWRLTLRCLELLCVAACCWLLLVVAGVCCRCRDVFSVVACCLCLLKFVVVCCMPFVCCCLSAVI